MVGVESRVHGNELIICGKKNIVKFAELIGFRSRYKMKILKEMISSYRRR